MTFRWCVAGLLAVVMAGCASVVPEGPNASLLRLEETKQRKEAFEHQIKLEQRLIDVAYQMMHAAEPICGGNAIYDAGVFVAISGSYNPVWRPIATELLGLDDVMRVTLIVAGTSGAEAGFRPGDAIIDIGGMPLAPGPRGFNKGLKKWSEANAKGEPYTVTVVRDDAQHTLTVTPKKKYCYYTVRLDDSGEVNAYADGATIAVTRGMMRFTETDQELALIVGHELSHNLFMHYASPWQMQLFETQADIGGLYMMAWTGLPIDNAATFWRRIGKEYPADITADPQKSHPSSPMRFLMLEKTIEEIHAKQAAGEPLVPEIRGEAFRRIVGENLEYLGIGREGSRPIPAIPPAGASPGPD